MIYRVNLYDEADGSQGFKFFGSKREASSCLSDWKRESPKMRQRADIDEAETPKSKAEMMRLLGRWGGEPQNG